MASVLEGRMRRPTIGLGGLLAALLCLAGLASPAQGAPEDKALGRPATASSVETGDNRFGCGPSVCAAEKANDGASATRWSSAVSDGQNWTVDLGAPRLVDTVAIEWENAYASQYRVDVSLDGRTFAPVAEGLIALGPAARAVVELTKRLEQTIAFATQEVRFVRITGVQRSNPRWGISFWTAGVFGPADAVPPPPAPAPAPATGTAGSPAPAPAPANPFNSTGPPAPAPPPNAPAPPAPAPGAKAPLKLLAPFPVVRIIGTATGSGASIKRFSIRAPRSAQVRVRCAGGGCPRRTLRRRGSGRVSGVQRRLRVGAVVEVFVTQRGRVGKYTRFTIRKGMAPRRLDSCALHGARRPTRCPAR